MVTTSSPEVAMQQMVDELVEQFDPEKVYLLDVLMSGDQQVWHEAKFMVVLGGKWDYGEKVIEIGVAMPRTGFGKFFHLVSPEQFAQRCEDKRTHEYSALSEGRLLYERS